MNFIKENWFKLIIAVCAVIISICYYCSIIEEQYYFINTNEGIYSCDRKDGHCFNETGIKKSIEEIFGR